VYRLRNNEQAVLKYLLSNEGHTYQDIGKKVGLNEASVRRICNNLRTEDVFYQLNVPNFAGLGHTVMIIQTMHLSNAAFMQAKEISDNFKKEWDNCVDCHETFDWKIIIRSVWPNVEAFKCKHVEFFKKYGTSWLTKESIDLIPLKEDSKFIRIRGFV
jgi:hypothetical protein